MNDCSSDQCLVRRDNFPFAAFAEARRLLSFGETHATGTVRFGEGLHTGFAVVVLVAEQAFVALASLLHIA